MASMMRTLRRRIERESVKTHRGHGGKTRSEYRQAIKQQKLKKRDELRKKQEVVKKRARES